MKFEVDFYQDEDGMFIAECPSIPGCVSQGKTMEEAEVNIQDAIYQSIEARRELGLPLTIIRKDIEVAV
jgi:predicted RNase H-like HicB family nuclease